MSYVAAVFFLALVGVGVLTARVPPLILAFYLVASLSTFIMYAVDKAEAINNEWRTRERTLHWLSLVGGWPGALIAQQKLRHKTQKSSFRKVFWLTVLLNCGAFVWLFMPGGIASQLLDAGWAEKLPPTLKEGLFTLSEKVLSPSEVRRAEALGEAQMLFGETARTLSVLEQEREKANKNVTIRLQEGGSYIGTVKDGQPDGYGEAKFNDGRWYRGEFKNGTFHGHGTFYWAGENGISLEGDYQNGALTGRGIFMFRDGSMWIGQFKDNRASGIGIWEFPDGSLKDGVFNQDGYAALLEKAQERATLKRGWYRAVRSTRTFQTPGLRAAPQTWLVKGSRVRVVGEDGEFVEIESAEKESLGYVMENAVEFESEFSG